MDLLECGCFYTVQAKFLLFWRNFFCTGKNAPTQGNSPYFIGKFPINRGILPGIRVISTAQGNFSLGQGKIPHLIGKTSINTMNSGIFSFVKVNFPLDKGKSPVSK